MQNPMLDSFQFSGNKFEQSSPYLQQPSQQNSSGGSVQKYPQLIKSSNDGLSGQKSGFSQMYPSIYEQQKAPTIKKINTQFTHTNTNQNFNNSQSNFNQSFSNVQNTKSNVFYSYGQQGTHYRSDMNGNNESDEDDENHPKRIILTKEQQIQSAESDQYTFSTKSIDELVLQRFKTNFSIFKRFQSIWYLKPKHLADYGIGYSMYFLVVVDCLIIFFLIFFTSGIFNSISNSNGEYCHTLEELKGMAQNGLELKEVCLMNSETKYSFANRISNPNDMENQDLFIMITTIILTLYIVYIHKRFKIINNEIDYQSISPSDFTIWIQYNSNTDLIEVQRFMKHSGINEDYYGHKFLLFEDIINVKNIEEAEYTDAIVQKAPEPLDINWENLEISKPKQIFYKIVSFVLTIFFITLCLLVNMLLIGFQSRLTDNVPIQTESGTVIVQVSNSDAKYVGYVISLFIFLSNSILTFVLGKMSSIESHYDKTREQASFAVKLTLSRFVNIALIPFVALVLAYIFDDPDQMHRNIYQSNGLIDSQYTNFSMTAILNVVALIIDPIRLFKIVTSCLTGSLSDKWQEPEHNLSQSFSELSKTMLFTVFYAPLMPNCIIIAFVGVFILYPIQLYKTLYHRRKTLKVSSVMPFTMLEITKYIVPLYPISNIMFQYLLNEYYHITIYSLISVTIGVLLVLLPNSCLNKFLCMGSDQFELDEDQFTNTAKNKYKQAFAKYRRYYAKSYKINNPRFEPNQQDQHYNEERVKIYMEGRQFDGFSCL